MLVCLFWQQPTTANRPPPHSQVGLKRADFTDLVTALLPAPPILSYCRRIASNDFDLQPHGHSLDAGLKDLALVRSMAERAAMPLPVADLVAGSVVSVKAQEGGAHLDWSALVLAVRQRAGLLAPQHAQQQAALHIPGLSQQQPQPQQHLAPVAIDLSTSLGPSSIGPSSIILDPSTAAALQQGQVGPVGSSQGMMATTLTLEQLTSLAAALGGGALGSGAGGIQLYQLVSPVQSAPMELAPQAPQASQSPQVSQAQQAPQVLPQPPVPQPPEQPAQSQSQ